MAEGTKNPIAGRRARRTVGAIQEDRFHGERQVIEEEEATTTVVGGAFRLAGVLVGGLERAIYEEEAGDGAIVWGFGRKRGEEAWVCMASSTLEAIPEIRGVAPVKHPSLSGRLEYPVVISTHSTVALLDHGATHSFIDRDWTMDRGLQISRLSRTMRLVEFSGRDLQAEWGVQCYRSFFCGMQTSSGLL